MNRQQFLAMEQASRDTIDVKRSYIDISGDLVTGVLLSQIMYWNLPSSKGKEDKLCVEHEGHMWLAKGRTDWWEECRISPKQFDRSITILEEREVVITTVKKFDGSPTKHVRINWEVFLPLYDLAIKDPQGVNSLFPKGQYPISPKVNNDITERSISITESTAQTTTENTPKNPDPLTPKGGIAFELELEEPEPSVEDAHETSFTQSKTLPRYKPADFEAFYEKQYPAASGRKDACRAWDKIKPTHTDIVDIKMLLLDYQGLSRAEKIKIPAPAVFLNQERWKDEIPFKGLEIHRERVSGNPGGKDDAYNPPAKPVEEDIFDPDAKFRLYNPLTDKDTWARVGDYYKPRAGQKVKGVDC